MTTLTAVRTDTQEPVIEPVRFVPASIHHVPGSDARMQARPTDETPSTTGGLGADGGMTDQAPPRAK